MCQRADLTSLAYNGICVQHLGEIQRTFREFPGNIQGTFREHSNIQGTFREHSTGRWCVSPAAIVSKERKATRHETFRQHSGNRINYYFIKINCN
jgi:hypothetical protein